MFVKGVQLFNNCFVQVDLRHKSSSNSLCARDMIGQKTKSKMADEKAPVRTELKQSTQNSAGLEKV